MFFFQECLREKEFLEKLNDLLSNIEEQNPVLSDAQILMQRQLIQIQINYLKEKSVHLQQFFSPEQIFKGNEKQIDQSVLKQFILYYRDQIEMMKQRTLPPIIATFSAGIDTTVLFE